MDEIGEKEKMQTERKMESSTLKIDMEKEISQMSFIEKLKYVKSNITVEPVLALFVMPSVLTMFGAQNLNLHKACLVDLGFGDVVCTALRRRNKANYTLEENAVQELIASMYAWRSVVHTIIPIILMLFIGAWSDKTGKRKICMLMPIFGEFVTCTLNILNTYLFKEVPVAWTIFMEVIAPSLTGGWFTMFLGTFSYLGDITSKETRTFRLGILNLCMSIGFPLGLALSGVLLRYLGFYGVFSIAACLNLINFCYVLFVLEDHTWLNTKKQMAQTGCKGCLMSFFDVTSLKETFAIVFKKGKNNKRLRMCFVMIVLMLTFGPLKGEVSVMYLFARYRFNWNEVKYSIYAAYNVLVHVIGTLFALSVFSRKLKFDDATLGIISACSKICGALILAFARTDVEAFLSPSVEMLSGMAMIALRSIASKLVWYQDLGKVYSLLGVVETVTPLVFESVYSKLYQVTFKALPGTVFILSALLTIPALAIFGWFYREHKKDRRRRKHKVKNSMFTTEEPMLLSQ